MNNVVELLIKSAKLFNNKIAMTDNTRQVTYSELLEQTNRFAQWLSNNNIKKNDKVTIALYDSIDTCAMFFAIVKLGAIAIIVNPRGKKDNLMYQLNFVESDLVLVEQNLIDLVKTTKFKVELINTVVFESKLLNEFNDPIDTNKDLIACFLWTSGTTGHPKAVPHTHKNIFTTIESSINGMNPSIGDKFYCTGKLFFSIGLKYSFLLPIAIGAESFIESGLSTPYTVKKNLSQYKPSRFYSVPVIYSYLLEQQNFDIPKAKFYASGDKLPQLMIDKWKSLTSQPIHSLFGTTECFSAILYNREGTADLGTPMPGFELRIADNNDIVVSDGVVGSLQVKASTMGLCYYNDAVETSKKFKEWMNTGDLAYRTSDNHFHHMGRTSDIIKINGQFINPIEIEETIQQFPGVLQSAVISKLGNNDIEEIEAFVVSDKMVNIDRSKLKKWVISRHEKHACPKVFHMVDELPRTDTGKIQRYLLKD